MNWFVRNLLWVHLAALIVAFSWIEGGTRADLLLPVIPWLSAFVLEWLLVFPQAKSAETLAEARLRVWRSLARDPLTYIALVFFVVLLMPLFNVAQAPVFDVAHNVWKNFAPPVRWLPSCVDPSGHAVLLLWFPPALVGALAARHGLLKKSKRALLEFVCWNSAALSVLGFVQIGMGTNKILGLTPMEGYFFSTFGYPNFAGAFFTLSTALSLGVWLQMVSDKLGASLGTSASAHEDDSWLWVNRLLVPMAFNFLGALGSLSRAAILLSGLVLLTISLYGFLCLWKNLSSGFRVTLVASVFAIVMIVVASFAIFKFDGLKHEINDISYSAIVQRVSGKGLYHARIAKEIFRDHPVFGVGGWGYPMYQLQYLTPEDKNNMQIGGGANVHNDTLQFLAEQGTVGFGLILLSALCLIIPVLVQAVRLSFAKIASNSDAETSTKVSGWRRVPLVLTCVIIGAGATVCHSLGDLPFRDPAVLLIWTLSWICVLGWVPTVKRA